MKARATLLLAGWLSATAAPAEPGAFSTVGLSGWKVHSFEDRLPTRYELVRDADGIAVLHARCHDSASGWIRKVKIDLDKTPVLAWRWRTAQIYEGIEEREKGGDDFPLRVYVIRDGGLAVWRTRSLVYVWSNGSRPAEDWPNPYTARAHMVALQRGPARVGEWVEERRNLRTDFQRYFGLDADHVDGVALMTDCDDSGGQGEAWYGDIRFEAPTP